MRQDIDLTVKYTVTPGGLSDSGSARRMRDATGRRGYLDWMRGLAVLIMIQAHVLDSWTRLDVRGSWQFRWAMIVAGFGAPMFLFLAGVSVALSAGSKVRRTGDRRAAAGAVMRRGVWIFFLAFVFRVQAWILGWRRPARCSRSTSSTSWGRRSWRRRHSGVRSDVRPAVAAFAASALAVSLLTPIVRTTPLLDGLPDPIEAYIRPLRRTVKLLPVPVGGIRVCRRGSRRSPRRARSTAIVNRD